MIFTGLYEMIDKLHKAQTPEDIFGDLDAPFAKALARRYHFLASIVHPDHNMGSQSDAEEAFKRLGRWHTLAEQKIANGMYGKREVINLQTDRANYVGYGNPEIGDLSDLYTVWADDEKLLLKLVRLPRNDDLLQMEAQILTHFADKLEGDPLRAHFPTLVESFRMRDAAGVTRRANVLRFEADFVTLADVIKRYPTGVAAADAAWMFNRLLVALAKTHELGGVHGAVVPAHFMIRPQDHNGLLLDWCYSVKIGATVKAISPSSRAYYAPEILQKQPATAASDLYMAAKCMTHLLGGDIATNQLPTSVPRPIAALLRSCLLTNQQYRANDAWDIFDQFKEILQRLYGKPTFRSFQM